MPQAFYGTLLFVLVSDTYCNVTFTAHAGTHDVPVVALSISAAPIANSINPSMIFAPVLMFPFMSLFPPIYVFDCIRRRPKFGNAVIGFVFFVAVIVKERKQPFALFLYLIIFGRIDCFFYYA